LGDETPLRHPDQERVVELEVIQQRGEVLSGIPVGERAFLGSVAMSSLIPRDAPELAAERSHLWGEHLGVHQDPMTEHDGRAAPFGVFVVDAGARTVEECHQELLRP
jgi:hypothetical protein